MQRRQSGGKVEPEPEPGHVKHCKYLCRGAQRWRRHQNANVAAQPKRCQDASGCGNVSLLIAQAFPFLMHACPAPCPLSPAPTTSRGFPVRSSVELQMCQLSTFRLPNGISIPHFISNKPLLPSPTRYPAARTRFASFLSLPHFDTRHSCAALGAGTRTGTGTSAACGMGHVVPFVAISWALFLFFVCN